MTAYDCHKINPEVESKSRPSHVAVGLLWNLRPDLDYNDLQKRKEMWTLGSC